MSQRKGAVERLHDSLELADFLRPVVEHPAFEKWFADYEAKAWAAFLACTPKDHDGRLALQTASVAMRAWRKSLEHAVSHGKVQKDQLKAAQKEQSNG